MSRKKSGKPVKSGAERMRSLRKNPLVTDKVEAFFTCDACGFQCRVFLTRGKPPLEECPSCKEPITKADERMLDRIIEHNNGGTVIPERLISKEQPKRLFPSPLDVTERFYGPTDEQLWDKRRKR